MVNAMALIPLSVDEIEGFKLRSQKQQEAQLLLGWPTHGAKALSLEVKVIELPVGYRCPVASMALALIPMR